MGGEPTPQPPAAVEPNRAALVLIAALANGIGLAPYLLFVDRLSWLLAVVPVSALLAFFALRKRATDADRHPSLGEWLLGAWSAVSKPSGGTLAGLAFYGMFYGAVKLFIVAAHRLGFAPDFNPSAWGFWGSIWFVALVPFVTAIEGVRELSRRLYPPDAWARSAFFPLLARRRLLALGSLAGAVAALAIFWLLDPGGVALPVLLAVVVFYTSFPLAELGEQAPDRAHAGVVEAVATVLQEAGYRVVRAPRTGKSEIDPLLKSIDLLARSDNRAFAVDVKSVASGAPVEWNEASAVRTAAAMLSDEIVADAATPVPVEPVLILVGGTVAQSLEAFSQRERVPVVHFENAAEVTGDRGRLAERLSTAGLVFPSAEAARVVPA